jgi:hypothetical protein
MPWRRSSPSARPRSSGRRAPTRAQAGTRMRRYRHEHAFQRVTRRDPVPQEANVVSAGKSIRSGRAAKAVTVAAQAQSDRSRYQPRGRSGKALDLPARASGGSGDARLDRDGGQRAVDRRAGTGGPLARGTAGSGAGAHVQLHGRSPLPGLQGGRRAADRTGALARDTSARSWSGRERAHGRHAEPSPTPHLTDGPATNGAE